MISALFLALALLLIQGPDNSVKESQAETTVSSVEDANVSNEQLHETQLKQRLGIALIGSILLAGGLGILWLRLYMGRVSRGLYIARLRWITWALAGLLLAVCYGTYRLIF